MLLRKQYNYDVNIKFMLNYSYSQQVALLFAGVQLTRKELIGLGVREKERKLRERVGGLWKHWPCSSNRLSKSITCS